MTTFCIAFYESYPSTVLLMRTRRKKDCENGGLRNDGRIWEMGWEVQEERVNVRGEGRRDG